MRRSSETLIPLVSNTASILTTNAPCDDIDNTELNEKFQEALQALESGDNTHVYNLIEEYPELLKIHDESNGYTLIHWLVTKNKINVERLRALNFDINLPDREGHTPLYLAVKLQRADLIKSLIKLKANVNIPDHEGCTPLHRAVRDRAPEIVSLLCENEADVDLQDNVGKSALHYAVDTSRFLSGKSRPKEFQGQTGLLYKEIDSRKYIYHRNMVMNLCLNHRANPNLKDELDRTPLHLLTYWFYSLSQKSKEESSFFINIAHTLLHAGADINIPDKDGQSVIKLDKESLLLTSHPIKELTFKEDFITKETPSLQHAQEWKNIPKFAIITGRNGSGKSHLLAYAHNFISQLNPYIGCIYKTSQSLEKFNSYGYKDRGDYKIFYPPLESKSAQRKLISQVKNILKGKKNSEQFMPEDARLIAQQIEQEKLDIALLTDDIILRYYAQLTIIISDKHLINELAYYKPSRLKHIFNAYNAKKEKFLESSLTEKVLFSAYCAREKYPGNEVSRQLFSQHVKDRRNLRFLVKSIVEDEVGSPPWIELQTLFNKNGRKDLRLYYDIKLGNLYFKRKINGIEVSIDDMNCLSSGEQLIIEMFCWQYYTQGLSSSDTQKALVEKAHISITG